MGLSPDQLRNALAAANVTSPQGFLSDGRTTMAVSANDSLHTADDFADVVISAKNGVPVRLKDVARVYDGQQDQYQAAWYGTQRAILMFVRKQADANVIATVDCIKSDVPRMQAWLPAGVTLTPFFDRTPIIRASIDEVQISLLISLSMVVLTMALFLRRLAPTLIAATAVPLSLACAFVIMYVLGYTLDNMSLMALVIAIGFVVDDAIVVIENVIRHIDAGMPRLEATLTGAREIGFTIVSITASLIAVFIPLLFAGGITGMFFKEFTITLCSAIAFSAIVSLTLTPALCGRFLKPHAEGKHSRLGDALDRFHARMQATYARALDFSLRHPRLMALQPLVLVVITFFLAGAVQKGLFPQQDTGMLQGRTNASADVSPARMSAAQQKLAALVMKDPAVESVGSRLGGGWGASGGGSGQLYVSLKPLSGRNGESTFAVMTRLNKAAASIPDIQLRLRPVQDLPSGGGPGGGGGGQYQVALKGDDLAELQLWLPRLVDALKQVPQLRDVGSDIDEAGMRQIDRRRPRQRIAARRQRRRGRQRALRRVRPAPGVDDLFGHQPVQGGRQRAAEPGREPRIARTHLRALIVRRDGADHRGRAHGKHRRADRGRSRFAVPDHEPQLQPRAGRDDGPGPEDHRATRFRACACRATSDSTSPAISAASSSSPAIRRC